MIYFAAASLCALVALIEGLSAGPDPMGRLRATRQPRWAPATWAWALIGLAWYGICFVGLFRLLPGWQDHQLTLATLLLLMLGNALLNVLQFRMQRLDLAFFALFPYWAVLGAFLWQVYPVDALTFALFVIYAAYQLFVALWAHQLWQMNKAAEGIARSVGPIEAQCTRCGVSRVTCGG